MPLIKASCPSCGDVELVLSDLKVMVCSSDGQASYNFRCPKCSFRVSKAAEKAVVDVLLSSGVTMSFWRRPLELDEEHSGDPISYDDLMEFHYELARVDWLEWITGKKSRLED